MKKIQNMVFSSERALYGLQDAEIFNCSFMGELDGESALKESKNLFIHNTKFLLRYPLWHVTNAKIKNIMMTETCRAPLWYANNIHIESSNICGIKAVRESKNIIVNNSKIESKEFAWFCNEVKMDNTTVLSEYPFLHTKNLRMDRVNLNGKYSFQYIKDAIITNSILITKDAFWHSENVTVVDSVINGEYLAWYSKNLKLIRCKIIGAQPLCYAQDLILEDCIMENSNLAFELSSVNATIKGSVDSIKNILSGQIICDAIGEIICDNDNCKGIIKIR